MTNPDSSSSDFQRWLALRSRFAQNGSILKILDRMSPDDPLLPVVEAIAEVQEDLAKLQAAPPPAAIEPLATPPRSSMGSEFERLAELTSFSEAQPAEGSPSGIIQGVSQTGIRRLTLFLVVVVGVGLGYSISQVQSAEARRSWDWNQTLIRECQKQNKKTCNVHVVPPDQW